MNTNTVGADMMSSADIERVIHIELQIRIFTEWLDTIETWETYLYVFTVVSVSILEIGEYGLRNKYFLDDDIV